MGRVTKLLGVALAGLVGLLILLVVVVYGLSNHRMAKTYAVNDPPPAIPRMLSAVMPWPYTRFMTDEEIHAVWLYVQSVPSKKTKGS